MVCRIHGPSVCRRTANLLDDADEVGAEHVTRLIDVASAGDKSVDCLGGA